MKDDKMTTDPKIKSGSFDDFFWPLVLLVLAPWIMQQFGQSMNADTAWLTIGAQRIMNGQTMATHVYDNNPPLALIFHMPIVWLSRMGIPVFYADTFYFLGLLAVSVAAISAILKRWNFLNHQEISVITATYVITMTILSHMDFGQRDHMLMLGLFPFVLLQTSMTYDIAIPDKIKWPVLVLGVFAILIKPPHGLLPTLLLIDRIVKRKNILSVLRDADFICLAIGTILYVAITWFFFNDYATQVLPSVLSLYIPDMKIWLIAQTGFYVLLAGTMMLTALAVPMEAKVRNVILGLYLFAIVSLVPFLVQMQGFHYHLMPAFTFFTCATFLTAYEFLNRTIGKTWAPLATAAACFVFAYTLVPLNPYFPRHEDYKNFEITKRIEECGDSCNAFYIFASDNAIAPTTAIYTGRTYASRFPAYWFLPRLLLMKKSKDPRFESYKKKFGDMAADDLAYYKPGILFIGRFEVFGDENKLFDYVGFFSSDEAFRDEMDHYEKTGAISVNWKDYFAGVRQAQDRIIKYDIYKRKPGS